MAVSRTNTRRYVAICDVGDCDWTWGPHGLRVTVSEQLRHHLRQAHGLRRADDNPIRRGRTMKTSEASADNLPAQEQGPGLSDYAGQLVIFAKGWTDGQTDTKFGKRETITADLWVYDTDEKAWSNPGIVSVFFSTVKKQLREAGADDDFAGVLKQGTERNGREWFIQEPTAAQAKLLDKWDPSF